MISSMDDGPGGCPYEENVAALRAVPLFGDLPLDSVKALAWVCRPANYRAGDAVFVQDETDDKAYALLDGLAELVRTGPDGAERVLGEVGPGRFVGALALLGDVRRLFTLRAVTPLRLLVLPRKRFLTDFASGDEAPRAFLAALARSVVQWEEGALRRGGGDCGPGGVGVSLI